MLRRTRALCDGGLRPYRGRRQPAGQAQVPILERRPAQGDFESWVAAAKETPGSWWPDWAQWIIAQAPAKVAARKPGDGKLKPLEDAPGSYVRVKA